MELIEATPDEKDAAIALYKSVIGSPFCVWNDSYPAESDTDTDLKHRGLFLLKENSELLGAVSVLRESEMDGFPEWGTEDAYAAEICRIVISPKHRGRGLAKAMVAEICRLLKCRGKRYVRLSAHVGNTPALRTYETLGFRSCGRRPLYGGEYFLLQKEL